MIYKVSEGKCKSQNGITVYWDVLVIFLGLTGVPNLTTQNVHYWKYRV